MAEAEPPLPAECPHTPKRGDAVDKLLKRLLERHDKAQALDAEAVAAATAAATAYSYPACLSREPSPTRDRRPLRMKNLANQLSAAREALRHPSPGDDDDATPARSVAALEARLYAMETDVVAATASRLRVEQELVAARAQASAAARAAALQRAEAEEATAALRRQLEAKAAEISRLDTSNGKLAAEAAEVRREGEKAAEAAAVVQRRLRERVSGLERRAEEAKEGLSEVESRVVSLQLAKHALSEAKTGLEEENARLRAAGEAARRDAAALREELSAAREQLEASLVRTTGSREAEEALRGAMAHRAALATEIRGLCGEVGRLQAALLEEKAAKEQLKQRAELQATGAAHEAALLRSKLGARGDEVKALKTAMELQRADAERAAEAHEAQVSSLGDKLAEGRRAVEDARRRGREELKAAEARWEERTAAAVETAVAQHQRRIQDLELQLSHVGSAGLRAATPPAPGSIQWAVQGSYAASILDYIPRSEHLRLMEARTAARDAEAAAVVATARAAAVAEGQARVDALSRELHQASDELRDAKQESVELKDRIARGERAAEGLRSEAAAVLTDLEASRAQSRQLTAKLSELEEELAKTKQSLENESKRADKASAGMEAATEAAWAAEEAGKAIERQRIEAEAAAKEASKKCEGLAVDVARLEGLLAQAEAADGDTRRAAAAAAERAHGLQERCARNEMDLTELQRQVEELRAEAERSRAAAATAREKGAADAAALLSQFEAALGVSPTPENQKSIESRTEIALSRCKEAAAAATAAPLKAARAEQEATAARSRLTALEQHYAAVQQQYAADMEALERTAREQVRGVRSEAEAAIAGLRRASSALQEQMPVLERSDGGNERYKRKESLAVSSDGGSRMSLASEVEELRTRLAQQAQQAEQVEAKEHAFAELLRQLTEGLAGGRGAGEAAPPQPDE